jgi:hypothetical protein
VARQILAQYFGLEQSPGAAAGGVVVAEAEN